MKKDIEMLTDCPVCGKNYGRKEAKIIDVRKNTLLVHTNCSQCKSNFLALISKNIAGGTMITMGMLTDLNFEEANWMLDQNPVSADEVLDLHEEFNVQTLL
jgi:predicted nucleic-acid-binding Zn-ribbon protein